MFISPKLKFKPAEAVKSLSIRYEKGPDSELLKKKNLEARVPV